MTPWRATARLQLHAGFTLDDAAAQVPYYDALGISHLYLSPIAMAASGSTHGYDVVDPGQVAPALGGEAALLRLHAELRRHDMGLLLDIVPNHTATAPGNAWWQDVLRHGRDSRFAVYFDIDWEAPGCDGKLMLPVLDRPYGEALREGALSLSRAAAGGWQLIVGDARFPLRIDGAADVDAIATGPRDVTAQAGLHDLLERQAYRLLWWRSGPDAINYRRFFDVGSLAALRVERAEVFDAVHALVLRLVAQGIIAGLRIDHVDGLVDPGAYLVRLRSALEAAARGSRVPIYVEKILAPGERLPSSWPVDGSTGYDFMDQVSAVLHDPAGEAALTEFWRRHSGRSGRFGEEEQLAKREIAHGPLRAERARAVAALRAHAASSPQWRDLTAHMLGEALDAVLARFAAYRTYATDDRGDGHAVLFRRALDEARGAALPETVAALDAICQWMCGEPAGNASPAALRRRVQQFSAPLKAKAVEDTAFYRHGVLLSRNEVGADPACFALDVKAFHAQCAQRASSFPNALLATATHDHKRGEDTRARLAVLSERADWWVETVSTWRALAIDVLRDVAADGPDAGDELMLYQTLVGAWPLDADMASEAARRAFAVRVVDWQRKALREAKLRSSWTDPDEAYERQCQQFVERLLLDPRTAPLRDSIAAAAADIGLAGACNGLAQTTLKYTVPGVPDLYQGCESWDQSLVDPDNRRAVDHDARRAWLAAGRSPGELMREWRSGAVKQYVIARLLQLRRTMPALFAEGRHVPVSVTGVRAGHVIAFTRMHDGGSIVVVVPRLVAGLLQGATLPMVEPARWQDTALAVAPGRYDELFGGAHHAARDAPLPLSTLLTRFPLAVLVGTANDTADGGHAK